MMDTATARATALDEQERADAIEGYLECAGWLVNDHEGATEEERERGYEGDHRDGPFTEHAREHASQALDDFIDALSDPEDVRAYLRALREEDRRHQPAVMLGHDLWLTRNGHGAGFWDRGLGTLGDRLSEAARSLGEAQAIVLDDGEETVDVWD